MNTHLPVRTTLLLTAGTVFLVSLIAVPWTAHAAQPAAGKTIRDQYLHSYDQMRAKLIEITKPTANITQAEMALQKLKAYRFLCGVSYEQIKLDDKLSDYCQAAAKVLQKLGKLDHNPPNPGVPEDEYKKGQLGCKNSNLAAAFPKANLVQSVDMWMFDSDPGNIKMLGHRLWCLNPSLGKTGFGEAGLFSAMWAIDFSHPSAVDMAHFPAKGFQPVEYFSNKMLEMLGGYAWSASFSPKKYIVGPNASAQIFPVDLQGKKLGAALPLNYKAVITGSFGVLASVVFRPADKSAIAAGKRYLVEITGVTLKGGGAATISYPVEFVSLAAGAPKD